MQTAVILSSSLAVLKQFLYLFSLFDSAHFGKFLDKTDQVTPSDWVVRLLYMCK